MFARWNVRWLFLALPAYGALFLGREGWPLVAALAGGTVVYILTLDAAARRWPEWVRRHNLFLRLAEIGLACIALSLIYLKSSGRSIYDDFYYDGFYAVFVILAAVAGGRRGAVVSAALATVAVIFGQVVQAPDAQVFWGPGALEYWGAVALYSLIYAGFFAAMAALALFAVEFQTRAARWNTLLRLGREVTYLQEAVLVCDAGGTITSVNPAAESLFGGGAELWGQPLAALFGGPLPYETREPLEVAARRPDGSVFDAEVSLSTYRAGEREVVARVAVVRDLSPRRRQEREAASQQRLASLERLAAGLAEELYAPLAAITASAESLLQDAHDAHDEPAKRELSRIAEEARRAERLLQDLRAFARSEGAKPVLVDVNDAVRRALGLREFARPSNVELVRDFADDLPRVLGVPSDLEHAFLNLLENAEQAVGEGGRHGVVRVRTYAAKRLERADRWSQRPLSDLVVVEISDSGAGIPPILLEQIFDPFFTTKADDAAGLGLSVVHGIVSRHGGVVRVSSRTGEGTVVAVELPAAAGWAAHLDAETKTGSA